MADHADLEIALHRRDTHLYSVDMRFQPPESDAEVRLLTDHEVQIELDPVEALALGDDAEAYGRWLGERLFADAAVDGGFGQALSSAGTADAPLRVRLYIGPTAPELHAIRWETLRRPTDGTLLTTGENILFSRFLSSFDWRPVRVQPRSDLRALVVVANPSDLDQYQPGGDPLAPVDVAGEVERARAGLGDIDVTILSGSGAAGLENIVTHLRDGYDILYLIAHGAVIRGVSRLWLEQPDGTSAVVSGDDVATRLQELNRRPRLVLLLSCQSAGTGRSSDQGALAALGPRLAQAGIPAVVAMQGNVTMQTSAGFIPAFFQELQRDGQVDRALAAARGAVRDRPDWWMPVLYMRLRTGRIWYVPGFGDDSDGLQKWPALLRNISRNRATPILGNGLAESITGSTREIAGRWSERYSFPMAAHDREDLPQVAQFLAVNQEPLFPREELGEYLRGELLRRHGNSLPEGSEALELDQLFEAIGTTRLSEPTYPYRVLAELELPIYITTGPTDLLAQALRHAGREPVVEICRWHPDLDFLPTVYDDEPDYRPSVERPLLFHLFGHLQEPDSLVITEDDYFDYLIGVTGDKERIPTVVRRALADTALLFLGFQLTDWNFRVLFRSIMSQEGRRRRRRYAHVAAQINPEEGRIIDPERARRYLESYFDDADISIFWGRPEDFLDALHARREDEAQGE